jgi:hypothetical protein
MLNLVPVVLHVGVILTLNTIYQSVAHVLTDWENHRTQLAYVFTHCCPFHTALRFSGIVTQAREFDHFEAFFLRIL